MNFEQDVHYINLNEVDPNYTVLPEDLYKLKVLGLKLTKQTKDPTKSYIKGTFAVEDHDKFAGRRLFHSFFNITESGSRDAKDLKKLSGVTGINQEGSFEAWLEQMGTVGPSFKAPVKQVDAKDWTTKEFKTNPDGSLQKENVIDFRNVQIA